MKVDLGEEVYEGIQFAPALGMAMAEKLGIRREIDRAVSNEGNLARKLSAGMGAKALIGTMFTEGKRKPLYRVERTHSTAPVDLIFGRGVTSATLQDRNLRGILDDIFESDMDSIHWRIATGACGAYGLESDVFHMDHTNDPYYGTGYEDREEVRMLESPSGKMAAVPRHGGNSKVNRNDLPQKNIMAICNGRGVLMTARSYDGNTSDTVMNSDALDFLRDRIDCRDAVVVADCKLADSNLIGKMNRMGIGFVTKIPHNFNGRTLDRMKASAMDGRMDPSETRAGAEFYETSENMELDDGSAVRLRFLVYRLEGSLEEAEAFIRGPGFEKVGSRTASMKSGRFFCEDDARKRFNELCAEFGPAYRVTADFGQDPNLRRRNPDGPCWRIRPRGVVLDEEGVGDAARMFSMQVLVTNIPMSRRDCRNPRKGLTSDGLLGMYIDQARIEHDFHLIKSGCGVNRMFLHTSSRQDAVIFLSGLGTMISTVVDRVLADTASEGSPRITMKHISDFMQNVYVKYYRSENRMVISGYEGASSEVMDILERLKIDPELLLGF